MPQPPPAAPQLGALGQAGESEVDVPAAKVERIRSVSSHSHFGQGIDVPAFDIDCRRAKTVPQAVHRYS